MVMAGLFLNEKRRHLAATGQRSNETEDQGGRDTLGHNRPAKPGWLIFHTYVTLTFTAHGATGKREFKRK